MKEHTPEAIVRRYRRAVWFKWAGILLAAVVWFLCTWGGGTLRMLLGAVPLYLCIIALSLWAAWNFCSLNRILVQDCDPETYLQIMRLLLKGRLHPRNRQTARTNEALALAHLGRFSEAEAAAAVLAAMLPPPNRAFRLSILSVRLSSLLHQGDLEAAKALRHEAEALASRLRGKAARRQGQDFLRDVDARIALQEGDYETFRRLAQSRESGGRTKITAVLSAFRQAQADLACGEADNARARLEYVAKEGGTLYAAGQARQLLAELDGDLPDAGKEDGMQRRPGPLF